MDGGNRYLAEPWSLCYYAQVIKKRLSDLLSNINIIESQGPLDSHITGLAYDSRDVTEGAIFFALSGLHTDGHRYIEEALSRGAKAVIH